MTEFGNDLLPLAKQVEEAVASLLPDRPNERLIYKCAKAAS